MEEKIKQKVSVQHLASWYFGNFCAVKYSHGKECDEKLHWLAKELENRGIKEMTHKEFCVIARENLTCKPTKIKFDDCPIRKAMGYRDMDIDTVDVIVK